MSALYTISPETLAELFHTAYERLAPEYGYETRPETRNFDPASKNGRLMIATARAILTTLRAADLAAALK